jgi:hypothetical protein
MYRALFLLKIDVNWSEQIHLNYLLQVIETTAQSPEDRKPKKMTPSQLLKVMV